MIKTSLPPEAWYALVVLYHILLGTALLSEVTYNIII